MGKLTWIKKRVRSYESYQWGGTPFTRRFLIESAIEDYNWTGRSRLVTVDQVQAAVTELDHSMDMRSVLEKFVGIK